MKILQLKYRKSKIVKPLAPFNFDATVFKPSHYPDPTKVYITGKYWFPLRLNSKIYGIQMVNRGTITRPRVAIFIFSKKRLSNNEVTSVLTEVGFRFGFYQDISDFNYRFKKDRVLERFLRRWKGMRKSCAYDLFGLLMIGIFLQNTVVKRSVAMTNAMLNKYGTLVKFGGKKIFLFWDPSRMLTVKEAALRKLKVGYRARLFIKTSKSFLAAKIDEFELRHLSTQEIKDRLLRIYGVGPETTRILLSECFHRHENFSHVAPWQQKIYSRLLFNKKLVSTKRIIGYINRSWEPWSDLAAHYIWEDIFWQRKQGRQIKWLEKEIRL